MLHKTTIISLISMVALAAGSATAAPKKKEPKPPPAATEKTPEQKEADRHFKSGVALFNEQKFGEALAEFQRAYEIAPATIVLYNMAGCHRELSHYSQAVKLYKQFLDEGRTSNPPTGSPRPGMSSTASSRGSRASRSRRRMARRSISMAPRSAPCRSTCR